MNLKCVNSDHNDPCGGLVEKTDRRYADSICDPCADEIEMREPTLIGYVYDDGGRKAAGYRGSTGDCLTRAIAIAAGLDYQTVYQTVAAEMKANGYVATGNAYAAKPKGGKRKRGQKTAAAVQNLIMEKMGFVKVKLPKGPRPTYTQALARYGTCVARTTRHWAALKNGALRDTFDGREYEYDDYAGERKAQSVWLPPV